MRNEDIGLCAMQSRQIVLGEIIDRFGVRPYGWNEWETVLIITKVLCLGEIQLEFSGAALEKRRVNEVVQRTSNWKKITVRQRKLVDSGRIEEARKLGLFIQDNEVINGGKENSDDPEQPIILCGKRRP